MCEIRNVNFIKKSCVHFEQIPLVYKECRPKLLLTDIGNFMQNIF